MALWSKIFGLVGGGAVAGATAEAVQPVLENVRQDAWAANAIKVLDLEILGQLLAQELANPGDATEQAARDGFSPEKVEYLRKLAEIAPGSGELIELLRREKIQPDTFDLGMKKAAMRSEFRDPLKQLVESILSPADLANAVQQGFIPDPGLLPGQVGGSPPYSIPVSEVQLDTLTEFKHSGYDSDRAKVLAELVGLPPGPMELLQMLNRNIITDSSYYVGIREGHTKTKWADALKQLRYSILTPIEAANLRLRGWIDDGEMYTLGALSGANEDHMNKLFQMQGRPPGPGQLQTAFNRGLLDVPRFRKGIQESDVREEWADIELALRVKYPSAFVLRNLTQSGDITGAQATQILEYEGIPPALADQIGKAWAKGPVAKAKELTVSTVEALYEARYIDHAQATDLLSKLGYTDSQIPMLLETADARRVKRFLDAAVNRVHTKFVTHLIGNNEAVNLLNDLNLPADAVADIMAEWTLERDVNVPVLTPAQLAAAVYYGILQRGEVITDLQNRGYSERDATILVDIRLHGIPPGTTV